MSDGDPEYVHREPVQDDLAEDAAELIAEAGEALQQKRENQDELLDAVSENEGAKVLETQCNIMGDITVPLRAKLNGELIDRMGQVEHRLERVQSEEGSTYDVSEAADDAASLLADSIDSAEWDKGMFYEAYREEGLQPLGEMLKRAFESLQQERERQEGAAEGFRTQK